LIKAGRSFVSCQLQASKTADLVFIPEEVELGWIPLKSTTFPLKLKTPMVQMLVFQSRVHLN